MESEPLPRRQRSPWVYVLLGCAGFAVLSCLGLAGACGFLYKKGRDFEKGYTDPSTREENARRSLGGIPEGYFVAASISMLGLKEMTAFTDAPPLPDGGFELRGHRVFVYFSLAASQQAPGCRDFWTKDGTDTLALRQSGINLTVSEVLKRGQLTAGGRRLHYVAARGRLDTGSAAPPPADALDMAVLFDCPGDGLKVGVWEMEDPDPTKPASALDLTGTVADEAALARFLAPVDPCRK